MSETNKPRQLWFVINDYDSRSKNLDVTMWDEKPGEHEYDRELSHVIEVAPMLKMMKEIGDVLEFYSNKTKLDSGEMASVKLENLKAFISAIEQGEK